MKLTDRIVNNELNMIWAIPVIMILIICGLYRAEFSLNKEDLEVYARDIFKVRLK